MPERRSAGSEAGPRLTGRARARRWYRQNVLLLAAVGLAVLPLAWRGVSCGQDFDFHLQSWMEVAAHWRAGVVYPHWALSANFGAGEPRFVFYPPLSWTLGGLLGVVLPWSWVAFAYTALALLGAAWSFRAMARAWVSEETAALAACVYAVNPYILFVAYERAAMAELLAAVWMPLLVLYGLRRTRRTDSVIPLALTVAALCLTNAPAAVMGMYFLALIAAVAAVEQKSWRVAGRAAASTAAGLALAGFWLVPALYEERWVEIWRAVGLLMRVQDSFLFGFVSPAQVPADERFDAVYHNHVLGMVSWIGVALLAATAVAAALAWKKRRGGLWWPLACAGGAIAVLQFRWSEAVWRTAPELDFLQFPWRWLLVLGLVVAGLAALALGDGGGTRGARRARAGMVVALACGMAVLAGLVFWLPCDQDDNVRAQVATFHGTGFAGTDEYTPRGAENDEILAGTPAVLVVRSAHAEEGGTPDQEVWTSVPAEEIPAKVDVERWSGERRAVAVTSPEAGFAVLRLMEYPAWRLTVDGRAVPPAQRIHRDDGLMVIPVAAGTTRIAARWGTTADEWVGRGISLAALAITLALFFIERRTRRGRGIQ